MKILIIAAHPDDEVLGCGATSARFAREGNTVVPVIICENASVRYETEMRNYLEECAKKSALSIFNLPGSSIKTKRCHEFLKPSL